MSLLTPIRHYVDALVHPAARQDASAAALHRAFIAPRLIGSLACLAAVPLYLALRGAPNFLELVAFGWLIAPLALAVYLSRTGRWAQAQVFSSLATCALFALSLWVAATTEFAGITLLSACVAVLCAAFLASNARNLAETGAQRAARDERYDLLAGNIDDVILRHGDAGHVLFASPATETLLGEPATAFKGRGLFDRVHVHDRPAYLAALDDAAKAGAARTIEFRVRRDHGAAHFVWVEMRCRPFGAAGEVVAVLRDISERKAQEQSLQDARAEAERASAGKARFLATMSHELRTPLNAIIGFSDMMTNAEIKLDDARRHEYAGLINESGRHLLSVVNGILDMSKMETGNFEITPEPFAPGQVVSGCCDLLALKARESDVALSVRIAKDLPEIIADRRALNQILINLVSNAIKFTERGGKVAVAAVRDGHHFAVTVEDTGVGIGEDDLPRLGEAFFQARASYDRRHDGTGLGLSIVKGLVRLHGGTFEVKSRVGEGTRVTVRLPIDCEGKRPAVTPVTLGHKAGPQPDAERPIKKSA